MQTKVGALFSLMVCVIVAVTLAVPAWADSETYVVGATASGDANFMLSNNDGSFADLETLQLTAESGITAYPLTYGNGIGDFDNDGDFDYIAGFGYGGGDIYIFEKLAAGNQFASAAAVGSWNEGYYAMDMAVADFDGDGNQDFVMSYMYSTTSGLYLGNGSFGFTYVALENSAANFSAGIDAADFNNDGLADFVVGPNSGEPVYVNIANGDGTFTPQPFSTQDGNAVYGVAAADFNNDGNADIATAYYDNLIIYTGNGDGTFQWSATHAFELNRSTIDNYDFDGDGNQDLVAANFGSAYDGVAVLMGNGDGTFTYDATYSGGTGGYLDAVSCPPYEAAPNIEPVAVLDPLVYEVTVGEAVEFDGSQSYDEDGEIVDYTWEFGDEDQGVGLDQVAGFDTAADRQIHTYNEAGLYLVTLLVTDDKGATGSVEAEVHVAEPAVSFTVRFTPRKLNLKSRGKWIKARIRVSSDYDARKIDFTSLRIVTEQETVIKAYPNANHGFIRKLLKKYGSKRNFSVRFDRKAVSDALAGASGKTVLKLEGKILRSDGQLVDFTGSQTIEVIGKKMKKVKAMKKIKKIARHAQKSRRK